MIAHRIEKCPDSTGSAPAPDDLFDKGNCSASSVDENPLKNAVLCYLKRIGKTPLLTREQEAALARQMEEGRFEVFLSLMEIPTSAARLFSLVDEFKSGRRDEGDIVDLSTDFVTFERRDFNQDMNDFAFLLEQHRKMLLEKGRVYNRDSLFGFFVSAESNAVGKRVFHLLETEYVPLLKMWKRGGRTEARTTVYVNPPTPAKAASLLSRIDEAHRSVLSANKAMVEANLRLVVNLAKRFARSSMPLLDLIQEGNIGLMKAVERFDYRRGLKFSTYATWWIRQSIARSMAEQGRTIRIPVHLIEGRSRLRRALSRLEYKLGREPSEAELCQELGMNAEQLERCRNLMKDTISLDMEIGDGDNDVKSFIEDPNSQDPEKEVEKQSMGECMQRVLCSLPAREEKIIKMRYGIGLDRPCTLEEVGSDFKLTRERIRQLEIKAIETLRRSPQGEILAAFTA